MAGTDERVTAAHVARSFDISENHVAKVLQQLARAHIIRSVRGAGGGYVLARDPGALTMLEIVECLDGAFFDPCAGCALRHDEGDCAPHAAACAIQQVLHELNEQVYYTMKSVTIRTLARQGAVRGLQLLEPRGDLGSKAG